MTHGETHHPRLRSILGSKAGLKIESTKNAAGERCYHVVKQPARRQVRLQTPLPVRAGAAFPARGDRSSDVTGPSHHGARRASKPTAGACQLLKISALEAFWGRFDDPESQSNAVSRAACGACVENERVSLAPQSGHVSNFYGPNGPMIEPVGRYIVFRVICARRRCLSTAGTQLGHVSNSPESSLISLAGADLCEDGTLG